MGCHFHPEMERINYSFVNLILNRNISLCQKMTRIEKDNFLINSKNIDKVTFYEDDGIINTLIITFKNSDIYYQHGNFSPADVEDFFVSLVENGGCWKSILTEYF